MGKIFPVCQCQEQKQRQESSSLEAPPFPDSTPSPPSLSSPRWCADHEVAIPTEETVQSLDIKEECISTLLCYLELHGWLEVMNIINNSCTLKYYGGPRQLRALAQRFLLWQQLPQDSERIYTHPTTEAYICLLYTSPSPRDATLSRMPSSA